MVNERVQWSSVGNDLHTCTGVPGAVLAGAYAKCAHISWTHLQWSLVAAKWLD